MKTVTSCFGKNIKVGISGGSHEPVLHLEATGLPQGESFSLSRLQDFLKKRSTGRGKFASPRKEADIPEFIRGVAVGDDGDTAILTGETLSVILRNRDARSGDYKFKDTPRPGHADYTGYLKYGDEVSLAGGGPFSARMTAPLCIIGGIALQILERRGVTVGAHILSLEGLQDEGFDPVRVSAEQLKQLAAMEFPALRGDMEAEADRLADELLAAGDTAGGVIEVAAAGVPTGLGGAMYDALEGQLATVYFGIPAVKGVEFGAGFGAAALRGSQNNDVFSFCEQSGRVVTLTNNHGGILGGITSGMPLIARLAFKPIPSISMPQTTLNIATRRQEELVIGGRHDTFVLPRAVPIVTAATAAVLLDALMEADFAGIQKVFAHFGVKSDKKNVLLIGMPGSGKTTIGKLLASAFDLPFIDFDGEIEKRAGKTVPEIFAEGGETAFRRLETEVALDMSQKKNCILAAGGGTVTREENMTALSESCFIILLQRPLERLSTAGRPLSQGQNAVEKLYAERLPLYQKWADMTVTFSL